MNHPFQQWENALKFMSEAQEDVKELVSKWKEMLNTEPGCVEFHFFDGSMYTIPNFAKMLGQMTVWSAASDPGTLVLRDERGGITAKNVGLEDGRCKTEINPCWTDIKHAPDGEFSKAQAYSARHNWDGLTVYGDGLGGREGAPEVIKLTRGGADSDPRLTMKPKSGGALTVSKNGINYRSDRVIDSEYDTVWSIDDGTGTDKSGPYLYLNTHASRSAAGHTRSAALRADALWGNSENGIFSMSANHIKFNQSVESTRLVVGRLTEKEEKPLAAYANSALGFKWENLTALDVNVFNTVYPNKLWLNGIYDFVIPFPKDLLDALETTADSETIDGKTTNPRHKLAQTYFNAINWGYLSFKLPNGLVANFNITESQLYAVASKRLRNVPLWSEKAEIDTGDVVKGTDNKLYRAEDLSLLYRPTAPGETDGGKYSKGRRFWVWDNDHETRSQGRSFAKLVRNASERDAASHQIRQLYPPSANILADTGRAEVCRVWQPLWEVIYGVHLTGSGLPSALEPPMVYNGMFHFITDNLDSELINDD